jgi:hypothetical protein
MATWHKREMAEAQCKKWGKTRERGLVLYVLLDLLFGAGALIAIDLIFDTHGRHLPLNRFLTEIVKPALDGAIGGSITGIWAWHSNEKRYQRTKDQQNSTFAVSPVGSDDSQRGTLNGRSY